MTYKPVGKMRWMMKRPVVNEFKKKKALGSQVYIMASIRSERKEPGASRIDN
jgi:hypothetical protein